MKEWITSDFSTITSFVFWGLAIVAFLARHGLKEWVSKRATHGLERSIAELQSKLRQQETELSSQLEQERGRLGAIQATLLELMATRKQRVEERTIDAVEKMWAHIIALESGHMLANIVARYKIDALMAALPTHPNAADFIIRVGPDLSDDNLKEGRKELDHARLYLPTHLWRLFTAYSGIITICLIFREGLSKQLDMREFLKFKEVKDDIKAAMPEFSSYVDEHEWNVTGFLADDLRDRLLAELRAVVLGESNEPTLEASTDRIIASAEFERLAQELEQAHPDLVTHPDPPPPYGQTQP